MMKFAFALSFALCLGFCRADINPDSLLEILENQSSLLQEISDYTNEGRDHLYTIENNTYSLGDISSYIEYIIDSLNVINTNFSSIVTASADKQSAYLIAISNILQNTKNVLPAFPLFSETGNYSGSSIQGSYTFKVYDQANIGALTRIMRQLLIFQKELLDIKGLIPTDLFELVPLVNDILNQIYSISSVLYNLQSYTEGALSGLFGSYNNPSWDRFYSGFDEVLNRALGSLDFPAIDFPDIDWDDVRIIRSAAANFNNEFSIRLPSRHFFNSTDPTTWNYSSRDSESSTDDFPTQLFAILQDLNNSSADIQGSLLRIALAFSNQVEQSTSEVRNELSEISGQYSEMLDSVEDFKLAALGTDLFSQELPDFNGDGAYFPDFLSYSVDIPFADMLGLDDGQWEFSLETRKFLVLANMARGIFSFVWWGSLVSFYFVLFGYLRSFVNLALRFVGFSK